MFGGHPEKEVYQKCEKEPRCKKEYEQQVVKEQVQGDGDKKSSRTITL